MALYQIAPLQDTNSWYNYIVTLPQNVSGNKFIILKPQSKKRFDMYLDDIRVSNTVGINTINDNYNITLYPNPSKEVTTLSMNNINEKAKITLMDCQGRVLLSKEETPRDGYIKTSINTNTLNQGVFYVRISSGQFSTVKKLIVF